ncbi:SpoIID/LytB domain-containing protein [Paenibacillus chondroitinus]|uniref:SpoIID/LytB domain-containing protein n=1 Tax=Paenibacillus chondroitinus TaxID=59842 RepID=A0ABU6DAP2_9BACL|nr:MULTISPECIES: SpoIID/LytB domain-containing protein [Paenibacillus]MCY9661070.1 SpoIID/LytB domain-containing protein [Paenibacillus anseongense]MEB4794809.1 SpoIID/LytB domain-containing protein [Paenibacillus chondroitinus]
MKRTKKLLAPRTLALITTAALTFGTVPVLTFPAHAAGISHLDEVRVALFIDSAKYKLIEPVTTLSSTGGMDISVRSSASAAEQLWLTLQDSTIRMSLDQYSVMMLETTDFAAAKGLSTKLATMSADGYVLSRVKQGKTVFQVFYGSFPSMEAAESASAQALKDVTVASFTKQAPPAVTGPLHLSAGTFASEAAALQQAAVYAGAGIQADVALQDDATGKPAYSVWIGNEASPAKLETVKQAAMRAVPAIPLQTANTKASYLIRKSDVTASTNGTTPVPHFAAGVGQQKTLVHSKGEAITVKEKADRKYRGDMEISTYQNKLALVNEVPMESYLYGVLGAELGSGWPAEALKAQAVAARTFAIKQGNKYEIAQVTDTTLDQAYYGMQKEFPAGNQAVDATKDEVISDKSGLISPVFSSNSGGKTADPSEVWGNPVGYLRSVASPDQGAENGKATWYRIQLTDGRLGYVSAEYLKDSGQKDKNGTPYYESTEQNVNVRLAPYVDNTANPSIDQLAAKEKVLVIGQEKESNAYSWMRGPYTPSEMKSKLTAAGVQINGELTSLEVSARGPSGRVTELKANGVVVKVPYPDALRSVLGGLPSTLFEIEGAGSYTGSTPQGANLVIVGGGSAGTGTTSADSVYVLSGNQSQPTSLKKTDLTALGTTGLAKPTDSVGTPNTPSVTPTQGKQFVFRGTGYGHGLGMSQWGARGFAEQGYDYKKILQTYYTGVNITKE